MEVRDLQPGPVCSLHLARSWAQSFLLHQHPAAHIAVSGFSSQRHGGQKQPEARGGFAAGGLQLLQCMVACSTQMPPCQTFNLMVLQWTHHGQPSLAPWREGLLQVQISSKFCWHRTTAISLSFCESRQRVLEWREAPPWGALLQPWDQQLLLVAAIPILLSILSTSYQPIPYCLNPLLEFTILSIFILDLPRSNYCVVFLFRLNPDQCKRLKSGPLINCSQTLMGL